MNVIKSVFSSDTAGGNNPGKVSIHPMTTRPTQAWEKLKVKQVDFFIKGLIYR